jgi:hypothetical protein
MRQNHSSGNSSALASGAAVAKTGLEAADANEPSIAGRMAKKEPHVARTKGVMEKVGMRAA